MHKINSQEYAQLVKQAQLGDKNSLDRLAEGARIYLYEYVFRVTLSADLSQDIVQECILEMYKVFHKLKNAEKFRAWLDGIAFNKIRSYYGKQWRHKTVSLSEAGSDIGTEDSQSALAEMINREMKEIVIESMRELPPRYRAILTMRCYRGMPYSEISQAIGCSEFGAQALFYRAKKALAKKLACHGLGKESLLMALVLFGKLTASSEAAAASVSVSAVSLKVSTAACVAAIVTGKTAIVSLITAAAITTGTVTLTEYNNKKHNETQDYNNVIFNSSHQNNAGSDMGQYWYFFPEGSGTSVMMRKLKFDSSGRQTFCQYLQNQHANYYYDKDTVTINNSRMYNPDLSVARLPTDNENLRSFLSRAEGRQTDMEFISGKRKGLLVISGHLSDERIRTIERHSNILEEEYFQFDWPQSVKVVDNRDAMHKRGWTYFTIEGTIDGKLVSGQGQIPFVYETRNKFSPWLKIHLSDGSQIIDTTQALSC